MTLLLAPFNYFTFYDPRPDTPTWARALVGFFDVVLVLVGVVLTVVQHAKYGRARLAFQSFPFFLGETLSARLVTSRPIGDFKRITFTLRCIEERTETRRSGNKTTIRTVCDQLWADEVALEGGFSGRRCASRGDSCRPISAAEVRYRPGVRESDSCRPISPARSRLIGTAFPRTGKIEYLFFHPESFGPHFSPLRAGIEKSVRENGTLGAPAPAASPLGAASC
jgi:hypothetical protein